MIYLDYSAHTPADPAVLEAAKAEFRKQTAEGYTCPIPAGAVPVVPD